MGVLPSHFIVSLKNEHKSVEGYRAVLEQISGLSRSLIMPYLNGLIDEHTKGDVRFNYQMANKETAIYRPSIGYLANPSASLKKDLKEGYLSSIELIDRKVDGEDGPDADARIKQVSRKLKYHLQPVTDVSMVKKLLTKLSLKAKDEGYDYLSVRVRNSDTGKYIPSRFKIEEGDAIDKLYNRAETLTGFTVDLESCYDSLHDVLTVRMIQTLNDDSKW